MTRKFLFTLSNNSFHRTELVDSLPAGHSPLEQLIVTFRGSEGFQSLDTLLVHSPRETHLSVEHAATVAGPQTPLSSILAELLCDAKAEVVWHSLGGVATQIGYRAPNRGV